MSRLYTVILISLLPLAVFSQRPDERLQGKWLCLAVTDSMGNPSNGEFGTSRNFLKFEFEGKKLFVALAPFDKGMEERINYYPNTFEIVNPNRSQQQYRIEEVTADELTLRTIDAKNRKIYYQFTNAAQYNKDLDQISNVRFYESLIIQVTYVKSAFGFYLNSFYRIDNSILNRLPCPQFVDKEYFSMGSYLEENLRLPLMTIKALNGKESVFEFDVTNRGIENISIVEKLGEEIDFEIYDLIRGMEKSWQPLIVDGKLMVIRVRFKVSFAYKE